MTNTWKNGRLVDANGRGVFPALFFTSRTPTVIGQTHCRMDRFLGYHAGPHGSGYRRRSLSVPLATGGAVHTGIHLLAGWIKDYQDKHGGIPPVLKGIPLEAIAWAATEAATRYEVKARARGFAEKGLEAVGVDDGPDVPTAATLPAPVEQLILEQRTLIEAQVWVYATFVLPAILSQYRVLDTEHEESLVLDCTCGLGDGVAAWEVHHDRDCAGIVQQGKADLLLEGWTGDVKGQLRYDEVKTKATPHFPWEKAWESSGQLRVNMETASRRLGRKVQTAFIPVLFKGRRERERGDPDSAKQQQTALVYGWYDPGSPGFRLPEWKSAYKFVDDYGKGHTLPKTFHQHAIWDESVDLPRKNARHGASRVEAWVTQYFQPAQLPYFAKVLGPFPHATAMIPDTLRSILAEERDWRDLVSTIREEVAKGANEIDVAADYVSRSWECVSFDGVDCQFKPICYKSPGWQQPETMGIFEPRTPHHASEKAAFEAVGVQFPVEDGEEEFDEGEGE